MYSSPLLEEKGYPMLATLSSDRDDPFPPRRPGTVAALTADDHPVDSQQLERT
jgi:hypothetical protein